MAADVALLGVWLFALIGLYSSYLWINRRLARRRGLSCERSMTFDQRLLYYRPGGEPLFLVDRSHEQTVFFIEGFRVQNPVQLHEEWIQELYDDHRTNVIVPVIGKQSYPFAQRNSDWDFQSDLRTVLQVYDGYVRAMPPDHRVVVVGASFGSVAALTLAAERSPHGVVLVSPASMNPVLPENLSPFFRVAGRLFFDHLHLAAAIRPYTTSRMFAMGSDPKVLREDQIVRQVEANIKQWAQLQDAIRWTNALLEDTKGTHFVIVRGERDRLVAQPTADDLVERLRIHGSHVRTVTVPGGGHRLLLSDGREAALRAIREMMRPDRGAVLASEANHRTVLT
jgi:pimeloyl-ACP methyl ester carboxylesterase